MSLKSAKVPGVCPVQPSGDATGATDTSAIQSMLNVARPGGGVRLRAGTTYYTDGPLTVPPGRMLVGEYAATGYPTGNYGVGGLPLTGAAIKATSRFSGGQMILFSDVDTHQAGQQKLAGLVLDGTSLPPGVRGINSVGAVAGVMLDKVLVYRASGDGLHVERGTGTANPDDWKVRDCEFIACRGSGVYTTGLADSWWHGTKAAGNDSDNWRIINGSGSRYIGCKGENSGAGVDWNLTGFSGFTSLVQFTACSATHTWQVSGPGTGTFLFIGCFGGTGSSSGTNTVRSAALTAGFVL